MKYSYRHLDLNTKIILVVVGPVSIEYMCTKNALASHYAISLIRTVTVPWFSFWASIRPDIKPTPY